MNRECTHIEHNQKTNKQAGEVTRGVVQFRKLLSIYSDQKRMTLNRALPSFKQLQRASLAQEDLSCSALQRQPIAFFENCAMPNLPFGWHCRETEHLLPDFITDCSWSLMVPAIVYGQKTLLTFIPFWTKYRVGPKIIPRLQRENILSYWRVDSQCKQPPQKNKTWVAAIYTPFEWTRTWTQPRGFWQAPGLSRPLFSHSLQFLSDTADTRQFPGSAGFVWKGVGGALDGCMLSTQVGLPGQ